jgi:large subunit ribosomal protein L19
MAKTHSTSFSGVLMGVRRGGVETSFILRNVINKLGVEMTFKVCSPLIKDIQIVKRARGNGKAKPGAPTGLREFRRAKTYFIRDRPEVLRNIANVLKLERPNK